VDRSRRNRSPAQSPGPASLHDAAHRLWRPRLAGAGRVPFGIQPLGKARLLKAPQAPGAIRQAPERRLARSGSPAGLNGRQNDSSGRNLPSILPLPTAAAPNPSPAPIPLPSSTSGSSGNRWRSPSRAVPRSTRFRGGREYRNNRRCWALQWWSSIGPPATQCKPLDCWRRAPRPIARTGEVPDLGTKGHGARRQSAEVPPRPHLVVWACSASRAGAAWRRRGLRG
jgi:hypothetical protein